MNDEGASQKKATNKDGTSCASLAAEPSATAQFPSSSGSASRRSTNIWGWCSVHRTRCRPAWGQSFAISWETLRRAQSGIG